MPFKQNILANYVGMGVVALAPVIALPYYLSALGSKLFGLIGFITLLTALLSLLDAGMSQGLAREVSLRANTRETGQLLFGFERIYWLLAICGASLLLLLADNFAANWLHIDEVPEQVVEYAIYGAAAIFMAQFPGSIYRSILVGLQAQITLNSVVVVCVLLRHIGGVFVVSWWPTLTSYLLWQIVTILLETLLRGWFAWKLLTVKRRQLSWDIGALKQTWRLLIGTSGAVLLGALTLQIDKIVLSRSVPIEQFGYYAIATSVAMGVLQLIYPITQAALPRVVQLRENGAALHRLNVRLFVGIAVLVLLSGCVFWLLGEWVLHQWLRNPVAANAVYPLVTVLLVGTALNAFYNVGYINWIANAQVGRMLQVNGLALLLSVLIIPPLVVWQGTVGAAFGWVSINFIGLIASLEWLKRR